MKQQYARVIGNSKGISFISTLIGNIYPIERFWNDNTYHINGYWIPEQDIQIVFPECKIGDYVVGVGDEVEISGKKIFTVIGNFIRQSSLDTRYEYLNVVGKEDGLIDWLCLDVLTIHKPLYSPIKKETITIGDTKYYKDEVEQALKDIKSVK